MKDFEIRKTRDAREIRQAVEIIYQGFELKVKYMAFFTEDREQSLRLLESYVNPDSLYCAFRGEEMLGILLVQYHSLMPFQRDFAPLRSEFGFFGGIWRAVFNLIVNIEKNKKETLKIELIAVSDASRGKGIGSRMLKKAFELAREKKLSYVGLDVVDSNPRARKLYERFGFRETREKRTGFLTRRAGFEAYSTMKAEADG